MITVITTALPERGFLAECVASIEAQILQPAAHLIGIDYDRIGCGAMRNLLLGQVRTEWVAVLDDDDLADPDHLATLYEGTMGADIVYSDCRVTGGATPIPRINPDEQDLAKGNFIPPTILGRTRAIRHVGGWREDIVCADWGLYVRLWDNCYRFKRMPVETWTYRGHPGQQSRTLTEADLHL